MDRLISDEQAALRRVATLVARGEAAESVCAAVADEVADVLDVSTVMLARYEADRAITVLASVNDPAFAVDSTRTLEGTSVSATVLATGSAARIGSTVGVPITVDGTAWGVMTVGAHPGRTLPPDTESRLVDFTDLAELAISNAASRDRLRRLVDMQNALQRVATLVVEGAETAVLCRVVLEEALRVLDVPAAWLVRFEPDRWLTVVASLNDPAFPAGSRWPLDGASLSATILDTSRPARVDDYSTLEGTLASRTRDSGFRSALGVPILVDGFVWGALCVGTTEPAQLRTEIERGLSDFTQLVATAISKAESSNRLRRLADEQAALRRVATLVAEGTTPDALFSAVAEEVVQILDASSATVVRFESDNTSIVVAAYDDPAFPVGSRWSLAEPSINTTVFQTGRPARIDHSDLPGKAAATARAAGMDAGVGAPIIVEGSVWGMVAVGRRHEREALPPDTDERLAAFTGLLATAISNTLANDALRLLAAEQTALRRVATLVAREASPTEVFDVVADEVARIFELPRVGLMRYEDDGSFTVVATWDTDTFPIGSRWPLDGPSAIEVVLRTGLPARVEYAELDGTVAAAAREAGIVGAIAAPIVVDGATWGVIAAPWTDDQPIAEGTELRLGLFTDLVATAISNLQAHENLRGLANEHAALHRVATLVAEGSTAEELFSAVATEVADVFGVSAALLDRHEPDGAALVLAAAHDADWGEIGAVVSVGTRWPSDPGSLIAMVGETGRPARIDDYSDLPGTVGEGMRSAGIGAGCASPIIVDGQLWGTIRVFSRLGAELPDQIEARLQGFTELVATAISNATNRADLLASRSRIVAAGDEARRRIERNLHDGTQQRLIALGLDLQRTQAMLGAREPEARESLERMGGDIESVLEDVRELSRGLHPPLLSRGGLLPSLRALARRSPIPVDIEVDLRERPPAQIETALYYVVSEALTNAIKHSQAHEISVTIETDHGGVPFGIGLDGRRGIMNLHATIVDDGIGGAVSTGSGLTGLADRVDALGGRLMLDSPIGLGTRVSIMLPIEPVTS